MCPPLPSESASDGWGEEDSSSSVSAEETPAEGSAAEDLDASDTMSK